MTEETLKHLIMIYFCCTKSTEKIDEQNKSILPKNQLTAVKWTTLVSPFEIMGKWPISDEPEVR